MIKEIDKLLKKEEGKYDKDRVDEVALVLEDLLNKVAP
jgi:hypothetical protein